MTYTFSCISGLDFQAVQESIMRLTNMAVNP